jgi:hypothetical protein
VFSDGGSVVSLLRTCHVLRDIIRHGQWRMLRDYARTSSDPFWVAAACADPENAERLLVVWRGRLLALGPSPAHGRDAVTINAAFVSVPGLAMATATLSITGVVDGNELSHAMRDCGCGRWRHHIGDHLHLGEMERPTLVHARLEVAPSTARFVELGCTKEMRDSLKGLRMVMNITPVFYPRVRHKVGKLQPDGCEHSFEITATAPCPEFEGREVTRRVSGAYVERASSTRHGPRPLVGPSNASNGTPPRSASHLGPRSPTHSVRFSVSVRACYLMPTARASRVRTSAPFGCSSATACPRS